MPISSYLASTYLNPSDQPKKKRKTKHKSDQTQVQSLAITDDDVSLPALANASDDDSPVVVATNAARAAKKKTKANWTAVGSAAPTNAQAGLADQILQAAEDERRQREEEEEAGERPAIVGDERDYKTMLSSQKAQKQREAKADADAEAEDEDEEDALASGAKAGLQTASQVREQMDRKRRAERKRMAESGLDEGANSETVYRDASGRIISVADQKAAQRARDEEKAAAAKAQREALGGEVQASERAARREKLEDAKFMGVARYKDDKEMNDELKGVERWGDTMAGMVTKKKKSGKQYEGGFAPNRYGIRPGWRWDGVDRSNGFESKWFAARNKKKGMAQLEYEWQMDE